MKIYLLPALLCLALIFVACGEDTPNTNISPTTEKTDDPQPEPQINLLPVEEGAIYLERLYATNTGDGAPELLFDEDDKTSWTTPNGAGMNEGVMLYFEAPTEVSGVRVIAPNDNNYAQKFLVFFDGAVIGKGKPGETVRAQKTAKISSLYIRILRPYYHVLTPYFEYPEGDFYGMLLQFDPEVRAEISGLEILDASGEPIKLRAVQNLPGTMVVSSTLAPENAYNADFLFDSRLEFGWAEGADGLGENEQITFRFQQPVNIEQLKLWNGYQRSNSHFSANARIQEFAFGTPGNLRTYRLNDTDGRSLVDLEEPARGKEFVLKIISAYPGSKYEDLLLSELRFFDGQRWFGLESDGETKRKAALLQQLENTPIVRKAVLDRTIASYPEGPDESGENEILLRSNGTFVIYRGNNFYEDKTETRNQVIEIADGNWSVESASSTAVKIKVFGNLRRTRKRTEIYKKGKSSTQNSSRIYSEVLTIDAHSITGQKLVSTTYHSIPAGATQVD